MLILRQPPTWHCTINIYQHSSMRLCYRNLSQSVGSAIGSTKLFVEASKDEKMRFLLLPALVASLHLIVGDWSSSQPAPLCTASAGLECGAVSDDRVVWR